MLFNSPQFLIFFAIVYSLYLWLRRHHRMQNWMLLAASCFFYACWDWRFLGLLIFTALVDFWMAAAIDHARTAAQKKLCVWVTVLVDFGILGFFKYFNFFADNFRSLMELLFHWTPGLMTLHVLLPVGISFYTFQSISYVTDVYYGRVRPIRRFSDFLLFVTFFPHLVAGPIQRAQSLAVQVMSPRTVTAAGVREGIELFGWGLFKKTVIADSMAPVCDKIFTLAHPSAPEVLIGVYAFALQIYGDFAGYSDMARSLGKMMGFDIMINFRKPYFVTNPRDFWHHWHISLSEWLRDNLYIPLGGSRKGPAREYFNILLTMMLGGLWHGANWTFIFWGIFHGILLVLERLSRPFFQRVNQSVAFVPTLWYALKIFLMFQITCLGWLIFRAHSLAQVLEFLRGLTRWGAMPAAETGKLVFCAGIFGLVWGLRKLAGRLSPGLLQDMAGSVTAAVLIYFIFCHGVSSKAFIYFQF